MRTDDQHQTQNTKRAQPFKLSPFNPSQTHKTTPRRYDAALQMTKHFFPKESVFDDDLADDHKRRLEAVFSKEATARRGRPTSMCGGANKGKLTPATVEQMLGEHDKVDDFLDALEQLGLEKDGGGPRGWRVLRTRVLVASAAVFVLARAVQKFFW